MGSESHEHMSEEIDQHWNASQEVVDAIEEAGGISAYLQEYDTEDLFDFHGHLQCIDERTPGDLHAPGSGILLRDNKKELGVFVNRLVENRVTVITSHARCGAVELYATRTGKCRGGNRSQCLVALSIEWSEELARLLRKAYRDRGESERASEVTTAYISESELRGPENIHIARAIYLDTTTGTFDPLDILPPGFVISTPLLREERSREALAIALTIALGERGYGERFTKNTPLLIVPIAKSRAALLFWKLWLLPVVARYGSRVRIDGFVR